jgi:hypothetical protein
MRKNIFVAIGGSGAKVAEALIRLLAIGFPTREDGGLLTSAGDSLQIWRVDPDLSSGAAASLEGCIKDYQDLQKHLSEGEAPNGVAASRWAMDVDTKVRHLNPLDLPRTADTDNQIKTLRGILDSSNNMEKSSLPFLDAFYEPKDLDVKIDRGFYQKPFIGAAVMAVFAHSLNEDYTHGGKASGLSALYKNEANFFLCGSLHGGTGACGVPILGRFLGERKKTNPWRVGAGLLAPYCVPPDPPFKALEEGAVVTEKMIDSYMEAYSTVPALAELSQKEEKRELIRQILLGFFADPHGGARAAGPGLLQGPQCRVFRRTVPDRKARAGQADDVEQRRGQPAQPAEFGGSRRRARRAEFLLVRRRRQPAVVHGGCFHARPEIEEDASVSTAALQSCARGRRTGSRPGESSRRHVGAASPAAPAN